MKIIARPAGTGKTKEFLQEAFKANAQVLTVNKRALYTKADAYGISDLTILDWNDMMYGNYDNSRPLYIHKVADVIQELLDSDFDGTKLEGMSITLEE